MISGAKYGKSLILMIIVLFCATAWAGQWTVLGPDGGDVRSLSYDPQNPDHLFLGTNTGTIFSSNDGGRSWARFAHLGSGDDYVLDHIAIDPQNPKHMFVSAWSLDNQQAGDIFRSHDGPGRAPAPRERPTPARGGARWSAGGVPARGF